jgi:hypothetical protein
VGLLASNNINPVSAKDFASFLMKLRQNPSVLDVYIRVYDYEDAIIFDDSWVNSDTVYLVTSAQPLEVETWFKCCRPF